MKPTLTPVMEIKRRATEVIHQLQDDHVAVLITEHSRSAAVLLDVETYDEMQRHLAMLEGVARAERAFAEGRTVSHRAAKQRLSRWQKPSAEYSRPKR